MYKLVVIGPQGRSLHVACFVESSDKKKKYAGGESVEKKIIKRNLWTLPQPNRSIMHTNEADNLLFEMPQLRNDTRPKWISYNLHMPIKSSVTYLLNLSYFSDGIKSKFTHQLI